MDGKKIVKFVRKRLVARKAWKGISRVRILECGELQANEKQQRKGTRKKNMLREEQKKKIIVKWKKEKEKQSKENCKSPSNDLCVDIVESLAEY